MDITDYIWQLDVTLSVAHGKNAPDKQDSILKHITSYKYMYMNDTDQRGNKLIVAASTRPDLWPPFNTDQFTAKQQIHKKQGVQWTGHVHVQIGGDLYVLLHGIVTHTHHMTANRTRPDLRPPFTHINVVPSRCIGNVGFSRQGMYMYMYTSVPHWQGNHTQA